MTIDFAALVAQVAAASEKPGVTAAGFDGIYTGPAVLPPETLYDRAGRKRSPATMRGFRVGLKPANYGKRYPATPPTEAEVLRMLAACPDTPVGRRGRALIVIQWRSGLRIKEALDLRGHDLNRENGTVFVANGKGSKARTVGMDPWGFEQIEPWIDERYADYPDGPLLCIVHGPTVGMRWSESSARTFVKKIAYNARVERRVAPHQLRHALACQMAREGMPIHVVSRQLGHSNVGTTATYLAGISNEEVVAAVNTRSAPGQVAA